MLRQSLVKKEDYIHSYPYDWRTKKPVITVASLQWFVRNDKIKETALKALEDVRFFPDPIVSKAEMTQRVKQVRRKIGKNLYSEFTCEWKTSNNIIVLLALCCFTIR